MKLTQATANGKVVALRIAIDALSTALESPPCERVLETTVEIDALRKKLDAHLKQIINKTQ